MSGRRRHPTLALLGCAALLAMGAGGCGDDEPALAPPAVAVVIQGRMTGTAGGGARLRLAPLGTAEGIITLDLESDGEFHLEVPAGDYGAGLDLGFGRYWLDETGALTTFDSRVDTLRLRATGAPHRLDFPVGAIRLTGRVPAGMAIDRVKVSFHKVREGSSWMLVRSSEREVPTGELDIASGVLPAGDYLVGLDWEDGWRQAGESYWFPGVSSPEEATVCHVGVDSVCGISLDLGNVEARLSGRVTGAWQQMRLTPPVVVAYDSLGERVTGSLGLDEDGDFELRLHRPVPVHLRIESLEGANGTWLGGLTRESSTLYRPVAGTLVDAGEHRFSGAILRLEAAVSGVNYHSGQVTFHDADDLAVVARVSVPVNGQRTVPFLPSGSYLVHVEQGEFGVAPWMPQWYPGAADAAGATVVTVPGDGGVLPLVIRLERGGRIAGNVVDPYHSGLYQVILTRADDRTVIGQRWLAFLIGGDATFELDGLADGAYKVGASGSDWVVGQPAPAGAIWYPAATDWNAAAPVIIAGADSVTGLVLPAP